MGGIENRRLSTDRRKRCNWIHDASEPANIDTRRESWKALFWVRKEASHAFEWVCSILCRSWCLYWHSSRYLNWLMDEFETGTWLHHLNQLPGKPLEELLRQRIKECYIYLKKLTALMKTISLFTKTLIGADPGRPSCKYSPFQRPRPRVILALHIWERRPLGYPEPMGRSTRRYCIAKIY